VRTRALAAVLAGLLASTATSSASQSPAAATPVFDAASVKANTSTVPPAGTLSQRGGHLAIIERAFISDRTGPDGAFDFTIEWNPQIREVAAIPVDAPGLSFTRALRDHLGLRLQPAIGPVHVIVIDRIEHPNPD
jgi:hypothetical protein